MVQTTAPKRVLLAHRVRPLMVGLFVVVAATVLLGLRSIGDTSAATLDTLNFQARLESSTGAIVPDGNYNIQFKLYNVATAGTALWTETYQNSNSQGITVRNGYVTVNLGSLNAFPNTINWDQDLYLTMNVGGTDTGASPVYDGEMTPRLQLTGVPYAFRAGQLAKLTGANTSTLDFASQTGARSILLPDESGTICIQNSANCGFLTGAAADSSYVKLQGGSPPGTAQTGNFNISGTGIAGILQAATINATTKFQINGTDGATTTCSGGDFLENAVIQGGIITGGTCVAGGAGGMSSLILAGTAGSNQTITDGDTITIAAGTNITTTGGAVDTVTVATVNNPSFSGVITSTVATGTAPLVVASTTKVANLNADLLDGLDSTAFQAAGSYLTAEADTLATVTGRGATTSVAATFTSGATVNGLTVNTATATEDQIILQAAAAGVARFNGTLTNADLTAAQTWTLPDVSGTFVTTGNLTSITSVGTITAGIWQGTAIGAQYGGTGQSSYAIGDLLYASGTTTLSRLADVAAGSCLLSGGVGAAPTWGSCGAGGGGSYVSLQATLPGTPDVGNFNINGTGIANALQATSLDRASAGTLSIGTSNASAITLGSNGLITTVNGQLVVSGTSTVSNSKLLISGTLSSNNTSSQYGFQNNIAITPTGASLSDAYGFTNNVNLTGTALNVTQLFGAAVGIQTSATYTGQLSAGYGLFVSPPNVGSTKLITNYYGAIIAANSSNGGNTTGTIGNYQLRVNANTAAAAAGGTLNNYSAYLQVPTGAGAGTTNNYGLYIQGAGGGSSVYSLYNASSALSYFAGNVSIGQTANAYPLDVAGNINSTTGYRFNGTAGATTTCTGGNVLQNAVIQGGIVTGGTCAAGGGGGGSYVSLQATLPGTPDVGNFNINGTGIAAILQAGTFDTSSATALNIGTTNATAVNIGKTTSNILTTINGTALVKPTTGNDSTTAFRVQDASGTNILNIDSTAKRVTVGSIGTPVAQLYVGGLIPTAATSSTSFASGRTGHALAAAGNYIYTANFVSGNNAIEVYDVTKPTAPALVNGPSGMSLTFGVTDLAVSGHYLYAVGGSGANGFHVIDISNPSSLVDLVQINVDPIYTLSAISVQGKYAYILASNGSLYIYDISNPATPTLAGSITSLGITTSKSFSLSVVGSYAYVSAYSPGRLYIVNISNPASPTLMNAGGLALASNANQVVVQGRYAYVAVQNVQKLQIIDVSNPSTPVAISTLSGTISGAAISVAVAGQRAYVLDDTNKLYVVDIADPASPQVLGNVSTATAASEVIVAGRFAYVSASTLQLFDLGGSNIQQLQGGSASFGTLQLSGSATIYGSTSIQGGLQVGQSLAVTGNFGANGMVAFRNASNSPTAFLIQRSDGSALFTVDTSTPQIVVGTTTNGIILSSTGVQLKGTARSTKEVKLIPEFTGAVFTAGAGTNHTGYMTSDVVSGLSSTYGYKHNYYAWATDQVTAQDYTISVLYQLPSDFDDSSSGANGFVASSLKLWVQADSTTSTSVAYEIKDVDGTSCSSGTITFSDANWNQAILNNPSTTGGCTYAANDLLTITFKPTAISPQTNLVRIGEFQFDYRAKF